MIDNLKKLMDSARNEVTAIVEAEAALIRMQHGLAAVELFRVMINYAMGARALEAIMQDITQRQAEAIREMLRLLVQSNFSVIAKIGMLSDTLCEELQRRTVSVLEKLSEAEASMSEKVLKELKDLSNNASGDSN